MEDQSHQQKDFPYMPPFPLPLHHTSISIPNPLACMIPQEQEPLAKNDHSQRSSTYGIHQTPQFQIEETAFIPSQEVSSSEAVIHKDFASAASQDHMEDQSHQQKVFPYVPPFPRPLPHTSISLPNPPACMIPQEEEPSAKNDLDDRLTETNARQTINIEEMQKLIDTFKKTREILGFTQRDVSLVLVSLSGVRIQKYVRKHFESFITIFQDMCEFKTKVEKALENIISSRVSYSLVKKSESAVPGLQTEAAISITEQKVMKSIFQQNSKPAAEKFPTGNFNSGIYGAVLSDSLDNATGEVPNVRVSEKAFDNSENVRLLRQHQQSQPKEPMRLEELQQFVEALPRRRQEHNITQMDVARELMRLDIKYIPPSDISKFERFNDFIEQVCSLKPAMEEWLKDIHIPETQECIPLYALEIMKIFSADNPEPDAEKIGKVAQSVNLDYELVTIWLQKCRQIKNCPYSSIDSSIPISHPETLP